MIRAAIGEKSLTTHWRSGGVGEYMDTDDDQLRVEFFTRSYMPNGAEDSQQRILDRIDRLCERGILDDFERRVWGKRVCTSDPGAFGNEAIETVGQFRAWAERNDVSILPFFDERTNRSKITGEEHSEIVFPVMCAALYRDGDLAGVYPHAADDSVVTIRDLLASLSPEGSENSGPSEKPGAPLA